MSITTNSIGNYNLYQVNKVNNANRIQPKEIKKVDPEITKEEKNFFTKLYPQNKEEITDYHFYQRTGEMKGVSLGSLIDRRG